MDIKGLKTALPVCFKSNLTLLLVGQHGIGKSQGVRQAIEGQNLGKTFDFRLGQMADTGDLIGLLDITSNKHYSEFKMPKRIHDVIEYCENNPDKYGVIFLDEINRTTKDILQAIFELVLDHSMNGVNFPKNMKVVAAMNPPTEEYSTLHFDDLAFSDRFCQVKFEPSVNDWLEYARQEGVDKSITGFIGEHNDALNSQISDYSLEVKPSPRSWFFVDELKKNCHNKAIFQELLIGMVGLERATQYGTYLKKMGEVVKGIEVLDSYKKHKKEIGSYSDANTDRTDILSSICDQIKEELKKIDKTPKKWEKNLASFIFDLPKDLAFGFVTELYKVPSFVSTESDPESGFLGEGFKESKELVKYFENSKKSEEKSES